MKKLLLSVAILASSLSVNAQIADGSVAPDFTATDINGNTHTLSTYLAQGKTVIMDISATWCPPCWSYHNTHALENLWQTYGPNGSDEVVVLFIEGDGSTTLADIQGTGSNTQGDWTDGVSYPIIDNAGIANTYQITYFPTMYRICPDGFVYEIDQLTTSQLVNNIQTNCGTSLTGVTDHAGLHDGEAAVCSTDGVPSFEFTNYGTNSITSATVELKENGTTVATQPFSGSVATYASATVDFPAMTFNGGSTYTAELTAVNGGAPASGNTVNADLSVVSANLTGYNIEVDFYTDNYPSETRYEIRNSSNQVVAQAGPWQPGTDDNFGAGGPDALTTKTNTFTLPNGDECYSVRFIDQFGDGQQYGTNPAGQFGMSIKSNGQEVFNFDPGNFGSQFDREAAIRTEAATSSVEEYVINGLNLYPNPATESFNVAFDGSGEHVISVMDLSGRTLMNQVYDVQGSVVAKFSTEKLAKGSYIVTIKNNEGTHTENVVIK